MLINVQSTLTVEFMQLETTTIKIINLNKEIHIYRILLMNINQINIKINLIHLIRITSVLIIISHKMKKDKIGN